MTISPGTRLGPYEIVAPIGAGGMGEVYKARDTRLDRSVAIKILPAEFAQNAQLKTRFEREARTISQLSHPHICTLYDVGDNYLVMELLDGQTLADGTLKGALPLSDVLKFGAQIAEALGKAHREGVVHRDLKPGNIMITKSGAKLLDFGLDSGQKNHSSCRGTIRRAERTLSPDQKWLAYCSDASGVMEVYVQPFPVATQKLQISGGGGTMPAWRKDGHELYFLQGSTLMAATIHTDVGFIADALRPLFEAHMRSFIGVSRNQYDVAPDKRFLVNANVNDRANQAISLMQNWSQKRRQ